MSGSSIGRARGSERSRRSNDSPGRLGTQDDVILSRVGAFVFDYITSAIFAVILGTGFGIVTNSIVMVYVGVAFGYFGYYIVPEGLYGKTPGKKLAGLVVVRKDGTPISFTESIVRNLLRLVDAILNYAVGLVIMLLNDDRQRLGDMVADTVVVRSR